MKSLEDKAVALFILVLSVVAILSMACDDRDRVTSPPPTQQTSTECPEADSLRQVIHDLQFIVGQYRRMIECMQRGDSDCFGGV
jgi:hypothetical protein